MEVLHCKFWHEYKSASLVLGYTQMHFNFSIVLVCTFNCLLFPHFLQLKGNLAFCLASLKHIHQNLEVVGS